MAKPSTANSLTLVDEGRTSYTIIIGEKAPKTEIFAAEELQRYIRAVSDTTISIKGADEDVKGRLILVGGPETNELTKKLGDALATEEYLGPDGFIVKTVGENLVLAGSNSRGTLYSVYAFLERLGCRWFYPDPEDEIIPRKSIIKIGAISDVEKPSFKCRYAYFMEQLQSASLGKNLIDWMAKNRLNYHLWFNAAAPWDAFRQHLLPEVQKRGMQLNIGGHGFSSFLPPSKYFKDHPEWFSLIKGKRVSEGQFCLINEEAVATYIKNVSDYLKKHPEINIISLYPNDNVLFCECERCRTSSIQENLMQLTNRAAREVYKINPNIKVEILGGYSVYQNTPEKTRPDQNVSIMYAYWGRNYVDPFDASEAKPSFENWVKFCKGTMNHRNDITVFEYYGDGIQLSTRYPPLPHLISIDLKYFKKMGIDGISFELLSQYAWWSAGFNHYVFSKLCWDVETDLEALLTDYYEKYFGKAGEPMRQFFTRLESVMPHTVVKFRWPWRDWEQNLEERLALSKRVVETLKACETDLKEADELADDESSSKRVKKARSYLDYISKQSLSIHHQLKAQVHLMGKKPTPEQLKKAKEELQGALDLEREIEGLTRRNREDRIFSTVTEKGRIMDKHPFHIWREVGGAVPPDFPFFVDSPGSAGEGIINITYYKVVGYDVVSMDIVGYDVDNCKKWLASIEEQLKSA